MQIQLKTHGIFQAERLLNASIIHTARRRSLARTARYALTEGSREIRKIYNLKAKDIKRGISVHPYYTDNSARLEVTGGRVPLKYFSARQTKKGVTIKIKKQEARHLIKHAFIGGWIPIRKGKSYTMRKVSNFGGGHVYKRKGRARMPIVKLLTNVLTLPFAFKKAYDNGLRNKIQNYFTKEMNRNYSYYLSRSVHKR